MLTLHSPAKVNLFLRIIRRRADGYHDLASLFQAVSLCDTLHIEKAKSDQLICDHPSIPVDGSNLILKAATLFRKKTGLEFGVNVRLEKRIPSEAGLGGGSSNAATTLWALNLLCGKPATREQLSAWSAEIGSDIPFFFSHGTAYCTGRGEVVRDLSPLQPSSLTLVKPPMGLSTALVYGKMNVATLEARDPERYLAAFLGGSPKYFNDLEQPAFAVLPALAQIKQDLLTAGYETVLLSGSGSSFFV